MAPPFAEVEGGSQTVEHEAVSEADLIEYAVFLNIDVKARPDLLWIAREALHAQVPSPWREELDDTGAPVSYTHLTLPTILLV